MKVAIVDDEIHICSLIRHIIKWEELGLSLMNVFLNGEDVLAHFEKEAADILICDIEMPGLSGTELIRRISEKYPQCRCVVISGFRNFEYAQAAMQYGVNHYLLKPIDAEELNTALRSITENSQTEPTMDRAINEQSIRLGLVDFLLENPEPCSLSDINKNYHYHMRSG
ncbi:MAG: response regulator, partial [Treponema sp.]|nr:response regulator [Treponema sp.]